MVKGGNITTGRLICVIGVIAALFVFACGTYRATAELDDCQRSYRITYPGPYKQAKGHQIPYGKVKIYDGEVLIIENE